MTALFILIYLVSLIIHIIICYKENRLHIFYVKDLLKEIQFSMWFPILNTILLLLYIIFIIIIKICEVLKLNILWEKFKNIKLK